MPGYEQKRKYIETLSRKKNLSLIQKQEQPEQTYYRLNTQYIGLDFKTANLDKVLDTKSDNTNTVQDITIKYGQLYSYARSEIEFHFLEEKNHNGIMLGHHNDWIANDLSSIFKPFVGLTIGISSFNYSSTESSSQYEKVEFFGTYIGSRAGIFMFIHPRLSVEVGYAAYIFYGKKKIEKKLYAQDDNNNDLPRYTMPYFSFSYHFGAKVSPAFRGKYY
jgi:hypothetical protein